MFPVSLAGTMVRKQNIKKNFDHVGIVHHTGWKTNPRMSYLKAGLL